MDAFYFVKSLLLCMLLNVLQPDGIFRNSKIVMVLNQRVLKVEIPNLDGIDRYVSIIFVELGFGYEVDYFKNYEATCNFIGCELKNVPGVGRSPLVISQAQTVTCSPT